MTELARDRVRGLVGAERPDVDAAAASRVLFGKERFGHPRANACRIGVKVPSDEREIPERGRHQDVGPAAASDEEPRDILAVADHPLRWTGFVIDVARVDVGAPIDEQFGDLDGRREMQRRLPVSAARMHEFRTLGQHPVERLAHAEAGGRMRVNPRTALEQERNERWLGAVEHAEAASPPVAARVDVRAGLQQHVDCRAILVVDRDHQRRLAERPSRHRRVERRSQIRVTRERGADSVRVA